MDSDTINRLIELNRQFYQSFAAPFSETRRRLQPGVRRLLQDVAPQADILDLGCGNAEVLIELRKTGHRGLYAGVDFSLPLLTIASTPGLDIPIIVAPAADSSITMALQEQRSCFFEADLSRNGWDDPLGERKFQIVVGFACLHHIPGESNRAQLLRSVYNRLHPGGSFWLSVWQFLNSVRLKRRLQPWELVGLAPDQVDPGDYLLDWRHGGYGLRYVHSFGAQELTELAEKTGFQVETAFYSDGEGGKLSLYQTWKKAG